jgi:MATE family multidrug resistance protein
VKVPTVLIFIAYWVLGIPAGYILAFNFKLGAPGIWLGLIIGLGFSSFFLTTRFLKMAKRQKN